LELTRGTVGTVFSVWPETAEGVFHARHESRAGSRLSGGFRRFAALAQALLIWTPAVMSSKTRRGPIRVLVSTPDEAMARALETALQEPEFAVALGRPGAWFVQDVRQVRPQIAVLDRVHERHRAAQNEIAVLKDCQGDVRIVVLSQEPSPADAALVEQGVFFYLAVPSLPKVVALVHAAAVSLQAEAAGPVGITS
jgi:ActR/RegA family two-component response regulator